MSDILPRESETFVQFFERVYPEVKEKYGNIKFSLIEQFGRRSSFTAGESDALVLKLTKTNPGDHYWLFFNSEDDAEQIEKITALFRRAVDKINSKK